MKIFIILFWVILTSVDVFSQVDIVDKIVDNYVDNLEESDLDGVIVDDIVDNLLAIYNNPILINRTSKTELQRLCFLTEPMIDAIISYLDRYSGFYTLDQVAELEEIDADTFAMLNHFITIYSDKTPTKYSRSYGKHSFIGKLEIQTPLPISFQDSTFIGGPFRSYGRLTGEYGDQFKYGFVVESDPGEKGIDFFAGFGSFALYNTDGTFTVGNYSVGFGQGLSYGTGVLSSKYSEDLTIINRGNRIKGYCSTGENRALFGVAFNRVFRGHTSLDLFLSKARRDGNLLYDDSLSVIGFSSLQSSGYHRTELEIEDKDGVIESLIGGGVSTVIGEVKIGTYLSSGTYSPEKFSSSSSGVSFIGNQFSCSGIYYLLNLDKIDLAGELAFSKGGVAFNSNMECRLSDRVKAALNLRSLSADNYAPYGNCLSERSTVADEKGLFLGLVVLPFRDIKVTTYLDLFRAIKDPSRSGSMISGEEFLTMAQFENDYCSSSIKFTRESKIVTGRDQDNNLIEVDQLRMGCRLSSTVQLRDRLKLVGRFESSLYRRGTYKESGYLTYLDLKYGGDRLTFAIRGAYFNTDGYYSRVYTYENDMLYQYSIPSFYGEGGRFYLNGRYRFSRALSIYGKIGHLVRFDTDSLGSGVGEIESNSKSEFKILLRAKF